MCVYFKGVSLTSPMQKQPSVLSQMLWLPSTEKETECTGLFQSACLQLAFLSSTLEHFSGNLAVFAPSLFALFSPAPRRFPSAFVQMLLCFNLRLRDLANSGHLTGLSHPSLFHFLPLTTGMWEGGLRGELPMLYGGSASSLCCYCFMSQIIFLLFSYFTQYWSFTQHSLLGLIGFLLGFHMNHRYALNGC